MEMLGTPPMPWQEWAADVIGEVDDNGLPRWPMVIISVPRQSGKTTLMLAACIHRMMTGKRKRIWSTAQTGQKARKKWLEAVEILEGNDFPLRPLFRARKSQGAEQLIFLRAGSTFSPHPPTEDSLHGEQSDLNFIDEGWVFDDATAQALMQAIVPTQSTRPGAQTVIVSTMGTAASTWFHGLVDKARQPDSGIALLEWGIDPTDDPTDLDRVAACHPAYGHTIDMNALVKATLQLVPNEFARAYGNLRTGAADRFIPLSSWQQAASLEPIPADAPVTFGAAVDYERTETAIAACAIVDGLPVIELVDNRPGTGWAASRLRELIERHHAPLPIIDSVGPASPLVDELRRSGLDIPQLPIRTLTTACADLLDRITRIDDHGVFAPDIRIRPHEALDLAAELAVQRRVGDAWVWERRRSAGSIAALEAATLAVYGELHRPPPPLKPMIL